MKTASRWLLFVVGLCAPTNARAGGTCEKLADPPKDVAGRECSPGLDDAWAYVPQWKGFLLYGGCSPTYSNEGWFFDPDRKAWTLLWAHDALDGRQSTSAKGSAAFAVPVCVVSAVKHQLWLTNRT